jgi:hypothetical protein
MGTPGGWEKGSLSSRLVLLRRLNIECGRKGFLEVPYNIMVFYKRNSRALGNKKTLAWSERKG